MRSIFLALIICGVAWFVSSPGALQAEASEELPKIRALIVDGQNNHNWRETTPVLRAMMEQSGRFTVNVATAPAAPGGDAADADREAFRRNMAAFRPNFADYDVIVSNYNGVDWSPETMQAFEEYVKNGGGFVVYHAANNSFPNWVEYNLMIGLGGWNRGHLPADAGRHLYWVEGVGPATSNEAGRPRGSHGPQWSYLIQVRNTEHPITAGLPLSFRHARDELYDFQWGPAENVTILATAHATYGGSNRHEPIFMTISYGEGRVFQTVLGCGVQAVRSVSFITTFLRGAEWAATGKVTIPVPGDFPGTEEPTFREL